ncbi:MAG: hypothetical protein LAT57_02725, partial [Balneolales bacterium]|nr:hypothetical protein [Balneolales bacterium]
MKKSIPTINQRFAFCALFVMLLCQIPATAQAQDSGVIPGPTFDTRTLSMANATIADVYGRPSIGVNAALSGLYGDPLYFQLSTNQNWVNNLLIHDLTMPT